MTFNKEQLPDERLVKILSETQATINEHNRRQVRGSVEVDARLFESMLAEIQLRRHLMEKAALAEPVAMRWRHVADGIHEAGEWNYRDQNYIDELNGHSISRQCELLYTAPHPLTTSERAELENYRNAQQVVPGEQHSERFDWTYGDWAEHLGGRHQNNDPANYYEFGSFMAVAEMLRQFGNVQRKAGWNACRAAMLQGADQPQNATQNIPENIPAAQFKPVADLYGVTPPTGDETSFTFDAVEARDFINGGWSCQEYVDLERFQEAVSGNSPVIPDGWAMVPVEPTEDMIVEGFESAPNEDFSDPAVWREYQAMSGCQQAALRVRLCWAAMIASAPSMEMK